MHLFYTSDPGQKSLILDAEESRHCVKVLRMKAGEQLRLTDGKGGWFRAVLTEANPRQCLLHITEKESDIAPLTPALHMAVAPTKNIDRFEWFLEKATECGISEITPVICDNSERKVIKPQRLEKIILAAMKQSMRAWLPVLHPPVRFDAFIGRPFHGLKCMAHCAEGPKESMQQMNAEGQDMLILIGPEGDFSEAEISYAREKDFRELQLGSYRLRTETAALTACLNVHFINNKL